MAPTLQKKHFPAHGLADFLSGSFLWTRLDDGPCTCQRLEKLRERLNQNGLEQDKMTLQQDWHKVTSFFKKSPG